MHIFLTGPLQSGKSTAIARYLAGRPESPGGFRTRWDRAAGRLALELLETGESLTVAAMELHGVRADPAAFDAAGERLLTSLAFWSGVPRCSSGRSLPCWTAPRRCWGCCAATKKAPSGALFPAGRMSGCSR